MDVQEEADVAVAEGHPSQADGSVLSADRSSSCASLAGTQAGAKSIAPDQDGQLLKR